MITTEIPSDWRDLQNQVTRILSECRFEVETEKTIETARGGVELDVYAEETVEGRKYIIVCECKYWKSRVPQSVIRVFRTVMSDMGANIGYIISLSGFQSGAYAASELTNIELVTWEEFQGAFEEGWYKKYFSPHIAEKLDPLLTYVEPLPPSWFLDLSKSDQLAYLELKKEYDEFGWLIMGFTPYARNQARPQLPIIDHISNNHTLMKNSPQKVLGETGYRQFLEVAIEYGEEAISKFRAIRNRTNDA